MESKSSNIISENTPVRVGLIITLIGALSAAVWWSATITAKLDSILSLQRTTDTNIIELKAKDIAVDKDLADLRIFTSKEIGEIKLKMALIEVDIKSIKEKVPTSASDR